MTGASGGIGRATARALADGTGGTILAVARRREELRSLADEVRRLGNGARVCPHPGDLSLRSEVERLGSDLVREHPRLDAAVQNAGAWFHRREETSEGIERTLALNVLAPYRLTEALRPALRAAGSARVVMVSSAAHRGHRLRTDDLESRRSYRGFRTYGRSKLWLLGVTALLSERYRADGIDVNALHPGFVASGFGRNNPGLVGAGIHLVEAIAGRSVVRGARLPVRLAIDPALRGTSGRYFSGERSVPILGDRVTGAELGALEAALAGSYGLGTRTVGPGPGEG